jgi:hypothetical protein
MVVSCEEVEGVAEARGLQRPGPIWALAGLHPRRRRRNLGSRCRAVGGRICYLLQGYDGDAHLLRVVGIWWSKTRSPARLAVPAARAYNGPNDNVDTPGESFAPLVPRLAVPLGTVFHVEGFVEELGLLPSQVDVFSG